jgi:hypothetical protein
MEKTTVDTLQATINKRAADRLDADLQAASKFIRENRLLSITSDNDHGMSAPSLSYEIRAEQDGQKAKVNTTQPYYIFKYEKSCGTIHSAWYMDRLREYWLPIYIEEETQMFVQKVDQVKEDVNYLLDRDHLHDNND